MKRATIDRIAPPIYAVIDIADIVTPALVVKVAADRGGMGSTDGADLLIASVVLGLVHGAIAGRRLLSEERMAVRRADLWIASVDALVVLTLGATLLPLAVLGPFADDHASIANAGYPVVALWSGVLVAAIALAEATGRFVFWWLEPKPRRLALRIRARTTARPLGPSGAAPVDRSR